MIKKLGGMVSAIAAAAMAVLPAHAMFFGFPFFSPFGFTSSFMSSFAFSSTFSAFGFSPFFSPFFFPFGGFGPFCF